MNPTYWQELKAKTFAPGEPNYMKDVDLTYKKVMEYLQTNKFTKLVEESYIDEMLKDHTSTAITVPIGNSFSQTLESNGLKVVSMLNDAFPIETNGKSRWQRAKVFYHLQQQCENQRLMITFKDIHQGRCYTNPQWHKLKVATFAPHAHNFMEDMEFTYEAINEHVHSDKFSKIIDAKYTEALCKNHTATEFFVHIGIYLHRSQRLQENAVSVVSKLNTSEKLVNWINCTTVYSIIPTTELLDELIITFKDIQDYCK